MSSIGTIGVEINNNQAISGAFNIGVADLIAIEMPATWAGTVITLQGKSTGSPDAGTESPDDQEAWKDVYDDTGTEVSLTVAGNRMVIIGTATKAAIAALRYLRIRSGTAASPVNQSPSKVIRIFTKAR